MSNDLISKSEVLSVLEKVFEEYNIAFGGNRGGFAEAVPKAIESIPTATEYNNGWIPCTERMPEEHDSILAKYKGTDKWNDAMFEKISNSVNVTVADNKGQNTTTHAHTIDGQWNCDLLRCNKDYRIVAWQPLPEPYQSKGE